MPARKSRKSRVLKLKLPSLQSAAMRTANKTASTVPTVDPTAAASAYVDTTATITTTSATQPKEYLLWAYLLRKENSHLANRLNAAEESLQITMTMASETQCSLKDMQPVIEGLQAEWQEFRKGMLMLKNVIGEDILGKTLQFITCLRGDIMALESGVRGMMAKVEALVNRAEKRKGVGDSASGVETDILISPMEYTVSGGRQHSAIDEGNKRNALVDAALEIGEDGATKSVQSDLLDATGSSVQTPVAIYATQKGVKTKQQDHFSNAISSKQSNASISLVPDSVPSHNPFSPPESAQKPDRNDNSEFHTSDIRNSLLSTNAAPPVSESEDLLRTISCEGQNLVEYLELARTIRSLLPRRKQEGVVVETFWNGLTDRNIKRSLEIFLDDAGWTWNNLEKFCKAGLFSSTSDSTAHAEPSPAVLNTPQRMETINGENQRKKRKRRSMPFVNLEHDSDNVIQKWSSGSHSGVSLGKRIEEPNC